MDDERNESGILIDQPGGTGSTGTRTGSAGTGIGQRIAVAVGAALAVLIGIVVVVRLGPGSPTGTPDPDATPAATGYRVGDCVTADAGGNAATVVAASAGDGTRVVPCTEPHLIELTGEAQLSDEPESLTAAQWQAVVEAHCTAPAERYLGGRLDPEGRYRVTVLAPDLAARRAGDRTLWCGLAANWLDPAAVTTPPPSGGAGRARPPAHLTAPVRDRRQFWTYQPGECVGPLSRFPVPCTAPHEYEVVGELTLPDRERPPVDQGEGSWEDVVAEPCAERARAYLGHDPVDPWAPGWVPVSEGSWAAGKRTVTCFVGRYENGAWAPLTDPAPR